jgi:ribosome modulation factor
MSGNPYEEGFRAEQQGLTEKDCPYADGTPERERWLEGFRDASDDESSE